MLKYGKGAKHSIRTGRVTIQKTNLRRQASTRQSLFDDKTNLNSISFDIKIFHTYRVFYE